MWGISLGKCPNYQTNYLCHADVSIILEEKCKDKESCEIEAKEESFKDSKKMFYNPTTDPKINKCDENKDKFKLISIVTCICNKKKASF